MRDRCKVECETVAPFRRGGFVTARRTGATQTLYKERSSCADGHAASQRPFQFQPGTQRLDTNCHLPCRAPGTPAQLEPGKGRIGRWSTLHAEKKSQSCWRVTRHGHPPAGFHCVVQRVIPRPVCRTFLQGLCRAAGAMGSTGADVATMLPPACPTRDCSTSPPASTVSKASRRVSHIRHRPPVVPDRHNCGRTRAAARPRLPPRFSPYANRPLGKTFCFLSAPRHRRQKLLLRGALLSLGAMTVSKVGITEFFPV